MSDTAALRTKLAVKINVVDTAAEYLHVQVLIDRNLAAERTELTSRIRVIAGKPARFQRPGNVRHQGSPAVPSPTRAQTTWGVVPTTIPIMSNTAGEPGGP